MSLQDLTQPRTGDSAPEIPPPRYRWGTRFGLPLLLVLATIALLVGTVKGASYYNPWRYPERAKKRRDLVLQLMADSGLIDSQQLSSAIKQPLSVTDPSQKPLGDSAFGSLGVGQGFVR